MKIKKRYIYTLLFLVPGFFLSVLALGMVFAVVYGALWIFVYGDNPWPPWTGTVMSAVIMGAFFTLWCGIAVTGYVTGKRLESSPGINARHVWVSLGASVAPIVVIALHQLSVGNLGPKSDFTRCSAYCLDLGFDTSGMPPEISGERACYCYGTRGEIEVTVPIDELAH